MTAHILMCSPEHFGIHYEINPWMDKKRPADPELAQQQWHALHDIFIQLGVKVRVVKPAPNQPDMVFTANAGMMYGRQVIVSRFRHPQRQGEEQHNAKWFAEQGFEVIRLGDEDYFEGAGDALFCGETLFAGYRIRSDANCLQRVGARIDCRVLPLELVDDYFYHLDTCFCPLRPGLAMYFPDAFDDYGKKVLSESVEQLIEVEETEAREFACNAVVVHNTVVTNVGCPKLHQQLAEFGFETRETPLSEFVKAGGSAKCLTLRLDGEEAAPLKITL